MEAEGQTEEEKESHQEVCAEGLQFEREIELLWRIYLQIATGEI